jgi:hypothetical protein
MGNDTSRTVIQTYVPAYQRDEWDEQADTLGMSRSEFVKTMVQAGREVFNEQGTPPDFVDEDSGPLANLDERVVDTLEQSGPLEWEALLKEITGDIEDQLETTIQTLQENNEVRYSGREGGYVLERSDE